MGPLGRNQPEDWRHVQKFPLAALDAAHAVVNVPVILGTNWYEGFDTPERKASLNGDEYWVGSDIPLGNVRGGHCFCLEPAVAPELRGHEQDAEVWWGYYDQGQEGACVGFGCSRAMSLINRHRYDAPWLYHAAQELGGYVGQEGAEVRDGLEVLRVTGARVTHLNKAEDSPDAKEGITAYRWATSADEVLAALGTPDLDYVTILNSWGHAYPHRVKMPATILQRLLDEAGEAGVVTDR